MYPTKEEILSKQVFFRESTINVVKQWKEDCYNNGKWQREDKSMSIVTLLNRLASAYERPVAIDMYLGANSCYQQDKQTICLNSSKPSILTALHEFAHHLYGTSEKRACRWSIWLFKKCFPAEYEKLEWQDHMLVKRS